MTLSQLSVAFCDVIADALTVERTEFKSHTVATRLQALAWSSRSIASIVGLLISTRMQISGEPQDMLKVYWLYFGVSLLIPICGIILPENRNSKRNNDKIINDDDDDEYEEDTIKKILCLTFIINIIQKIQIMLLVILKNYGY